MRHKRWLTGLSPVLTTQEQIQRCPMTPVCYAVQNIAVLFLPPIVGERGISWRPACWDKDGFSVWNSGLPFSRERICGVAHPVLLYDLTFFFFFFKHKYYFESLRFTHHADAINTFGKWKCISGSSFCRWYLLCQGEAIIHYNKLQADPKQGKSLDIGLWHADTPTHSICASRFHVLTRSTRVFISVLKKVKHRLVENMSSGTADALGLSRAILCNGKAVNSTLNVCGF